MKLLLFYAHSFSYKTARKSLTGEPDVDKEESIRDTVVVFFHVEEQDEDRSGKVIQKFIKNTKWLCGKFNTRNVVLHSFNHLSGSKAQPSFSKMIQTEAQTRLTRNEYKVSCTPFGYFNEFNIHVAGDSLAKVFKEF